MRMICLDLISDALPFGRLWNGEPDTVNNAIAPAAVFSSTVLLKSSTILKPVGVRAAVRRFYWENLATSWRRKPIIISAIPRPPHQRTNHDCQIGRPEALMRCAKNLINSITPPMIDKINPQTFSVLGVNMHIGTTSNETENYPHRQEAQTALIRA
jgi:hypothetical protein